jgi:hypothetical protein
MVSILLFYVQTESNTARCTCAWGIGGKRLIEGKAGQPAEFTGVSLKCYVLGRLWLNCARIRQGIERGYQSENGLRVWMVRTQIKTISLY